MNKKKGTLFNTSEENSTRVVVELRWLYSYNAYDTGFVDKPNRCYKHAIISHTRIACSNS